MRGLLAAIYRHADGGDCSNGGISSRVTSVVVVDPALPTLFSASADCPALVLQHRGDYIYAVPADHPRGAKGPPMFGGNFAYSSDSRLMRLNRYPIPIHDRWESKE